MSKRISKKLSKGRLNPMDDMDLLQQRLEDQGMRKSFACVLWRSRNRKNQQAYGEYLALYRKDGQCYAEHYPSGD